MSDTRIPFLKNKQKSLMQGLICSQNWVRSNYKNSSRLEAVSEKNENLRSLSQAPSKLSVNHVGSIFKVSPESNCFSPHHPPRPPPSSKSPKSLTWVTATHVVSLFLPYDPCHTAAIVILLEQKSCPSSAQHPAMAPHFSQRD